MLQLLSTPALEKWKNDNVGLGCNKDCDQSYLGDGDLTRRRLGEEKKSVFEGCKNGWKQCGKSYTTTKLSVRLVVCRSSGGAGDHIQGTENNHNMGGGATIINQVNNNNNSKKSTI